MDKNYIKIINDRLYADKLRSIKLEYNEKENVCNFVISNFVYTEYSRLKNDYRNELNNIVKNKGRVIIKSEVLLEGVDSPLSKTASSTDLQLPTNFAFCVFESVVDFQENNFTNLSFFGSVFKSNVLFNNTALKNCDFSSVRFNRYCDYSYAELTSVDFTKTEFFDNVQFKNNSFHGLIDFREVVFHKQTQFKEIEISRNSYLNFENAEFKNGLDLSRSNFFDTNIVNYTLRLWGIKVSAIPKEIDIYGDDNIMLDDKNGAAYLSMQHLRETYRLIKQFFKDKGNHIDALTFQQHEMYAYQKELKYCDKSIRQTNYNSVSKSIIGRIFFFMMFILDQVRGVYKTKERIILLANRWSNGFGSNWLRGVLFTFLSTLFFFILFSISYSDQLIFDWNNKLETVKYFLQFLNITDWKVEPFGIAENGVYVILFIGRIFIGYGFYQTVQAFRKYKGN